MSRRDTSLTKARSRLLESESDRLQREVDNFTHKLEQQRRLSAGLGEKVNSISRDVETKKQTLQAKLPSVKEEKSLEIKIKNLQNNLQKEMVKLNDIQATNKDLRERINVLRREKKAYTENYEKMQQELIEKAKAAEKCNQDYLASSQAEEKIKLKMLQIKSEAEKNISNLQSQFTAMQSVIEEDRKNQSNAVKEIANNLSNPEYRSGEEQVDPHTVLEKLHKKWINACVETKNIVDQYHKNIKILNDAFNQIKEASGISDIEEIVTSFIKSEEQNYNLYAYVNSLNNELDSLEEQNLQLKKHYENLRNSLDQEKSSNISAASQLSSQYQELNLENKQIIQESQTAKQKISETHNPIENMVKAFEDHGFRLVSRKKLTRDKNFAINEQNAETVLGELEEYIDSLYTFLSVKKGQKPSELTLKQMPSKTEKKMHKELLTMLEQDNLIDETELEDVPLSAEDFQLKTKELMSKKFNI